MTDLEMKMTNEDKIHVSQLVSEVIGTEWEIFVNDGGFCVKNQSGREHHVEMDMSEKYRTINVHAAAKAVSGIILREEHDRQTDDPAREGD